MIETSGAAAARAEATAPAKARGKGPVRAAVAARAAVPGRGGLGPRVSDAERRGGLPEWGTAGYPTGFPAHARGPEADSGGGRVSFAAVLDARLQQALERISSLHARVDDARCSLRVGPAGSDSLDVRVWRAASGLNVELNGSARVVAMLEGQGTGIASRLVRRGVRLRSLRVGEGVAAERATAWVGRGARAR